MARGRHRRRGVWSGWLRPWRRAAAGPARRQDVDVGLRAQLALLDAEVSRLRVLGGRHAAAAAAAETAAGLAQGELAAVRCELAALRTDLAGLREELVWAFAERRLSVSGSASAAVIDLHAAEKVATGTG